MKIKMPAPLARKSPEVTKLTALFLVLTLICICIFAIRAFPSGQSTYTDSVAGQIRQEMEDNKIVLSQGGGRRTAAEFQEPILLTHGKESRLIVYSAELSQTVSLSDEGWGGFRWNSVYQEAKYYGLAEYTVDLSRLSDADFTVNNEEKLLTVRIPYAVLSPINILDDKTQFKDPQKGWLTPRDVELTPEAHTQLMLEVKEKIKIQLIDKNIPEAANEAAKTVVAELLTATVQSVDPEFTVVIVQ